jgi:hypothetical protein
LGSSIRASQLGRAEGLFSCEVSIAQHNRAGLTNNERWDEVGISGFSRPTKHTLSDGERICIVSARQYNFGHTHQLVYVSPVGFARESCHHLSFNFLCMWIVEKALNWPAVRRRAVRGQQLAGPSRRVWLRRCRPCALLLWRLDIFSLGHTRPATFAVLE